MDAFGNCRDSQPPRWIRIIPRRIFGPAKTFRCNMSRAGAAGSVGGDGNSSSARRNKLVGAVFGVSTGALLLGGRSMPRRPQHVAISHIVAFAATIPTPDTPDGAALAEILGGQLIAPLAGMLPDILEPATCGSHRKTCHSAVAAATISAASMDGLVASCRDKGRQQRLIAECSRPGSNERLMG